MLKLWLGRKDDDERYIGQPDFVFDEEVDTHCIETEFGKRVIYVCSGSANVINYASLSLPNGELISPKELSSGAKNIFVMDECKDVLCDLLWCGDNCIQFIAEIANRRNIEVCTTRWILPFNSKVEFKDGILIMNTGTIVRSAKEYIDEVIGKKLDVKYNL